MEKDINNPQKSADELTTKECQLAEKEKELAEREAAVQQAEQKNAKERLYDRVHISPMALDIFIGVCFALIAIFLVLGIIT